jgi:hypothetical protein
MAFIKTKFLNCIEDDSNLKRNEKALFRLLCGFWMANGFQYIDLLPYPEVMHARGLKIRVQVGHEVLARKLAYARSDILSRIIKSLVLKKYITYIPGTGIKGQSKNVSRLSVFYLNIPTHYELPYKKQVDDAVALKMAKHTLLKVSGCDMEALNLVVQQGLTQKATVMVKRVPTLKNYSDLMRSQNTLKSCKVKSSG